MKANEQSFTEFSPDDDAPRTNKQALNLAGYLISLSIVMAPTWRGEEAQRCAAIARELAAMPKRSLRDARALLMFACRKALEELERCEP